MAMMNEMEYRTIGSALAGGYRAAVYCRLSKDDDLQGESASIANQRDMLEKYCEKQGWEVVAVYQDDGFTGLNMERPDLQRMLRSIERRQINLVITQGVDTVIHGDITDTVSWEKVLNQMPGLQIVPPQSAEVFRDDKVDLPALNGSQHSL